MNGGIICHNIVKIMKSQFVVIYLNLDLISRFPRAYARGPQLNFDWCVQLKRESRMSVRVCFGNEKPPRVWQLLGALRELGDEEIYFQPNPK
jgi:hypothetical protein